MNSAEPAFAPVDAVRLVELYVSSELEDARQYENRHPLDDSGIYALHQLAARIFSLGCVAGRDSERVRSEGARLRAKEKTNEI